VREMRTLADVGASRLGMTRRVSGRGALA